MPPVSQFYIFSEVPDDFFKTLSHGVMVIIKIVHAGDFIEFEGGFKAKLTGIKVPDKTTKIGYKAFKFAKNKLQGRKVKVFTYTKNNMASGIVYDEEGYPFVMIVYGRGKNSKKWKIVFNELLLKKGYAEVNDNYLPDEFKYFHDIENKARRRKLGIWKSDMKKGNK